MCKTHATFGVLNFDHVCTIVGKDLRAEWTLGHVSHGYLEWLAQTDG
jgi:hypothetical protein